MRPGQEAAANGRRLRALYSREWAWRLGQVVRRIGGRNPLHARLPDVDPSAQAARTGVWAAALRELDEIAGGPLSAEDREDLAVFRQQVEVLHEGQLFRDYERPFTCFASFWDDPAALLREQTLRTEADFRTAIAMLRDIPRFFAGNIAQMRAGLAAGNRQPAVVVERCLPTIRAVARAAPEDTGFMAAFAIMPQSIPSRVQDALRGEARDVIADSVIPAHVDLLRFMEAEYLPAAGPVRPATLHPTGAGYYAAKVREYTTLDITPEEVRAIGAAEVRSVAAEMDRAMRETGFAGTMEQFLAHLREAPEFYARSEDELLMRAAWITKQVEGRIDRFFGRLPRRRFAITPVPKALASTYPPGTGSLRAYHLNTNDLRAQPLYLLPVLTLHEAIPGHCFQMALAAENKSRPAFRADSYGVAYGNAWALYCEKRLGIEMGIYRTAHERFGMWSFIGLRAARMVVDVGLHLDGWSRDRACAYLRRHTALSEHVVNTEVDRYISWPGQALGYYLGMLSIERMRARAEDALGPDFDLRAFHDTIMEIGSVPMKVLETRLERFIAEGGRGPYPLD